MRYQAPTYVPLTSLRGDVLSFLFAFAIAFMASPWAAAEELPVLTAALYAADDQAVAADEPYRDGRRALDQGRWSEAARLFAESAASGSDHADAAHYWQAYALHKDGRSADALEVLGELRREFTDSSWLDDASALKLEIRQGSGGAEPGEEQDDELKLLALNAFMSSDSDRALPLLAKFLDGDHSAELRERALFVLSQNDSAEAASMLLEVARGDKHAELRMHAVHLLGISDAPGSAEALKEIYRTADNKEVKTAVLHSFMVSDQDGFLLELAKSEPDVELRGAAIHQLGVMDATGALRELYGTETSAEVKGQILQSMFIGDDTQGLLEIIRTESDEELRRTGIRNLGLVGSKEASAALVELYGRSQDKETRGAIIEALFLSDDTDNLLEIIRTESDEELRRTGIRNLGLVGSSKASAALVELYGRSQDGETREAIIEALFLSDNAGELIRIARTESDPELRRAAFRRLSLMDDDAALDFMVETLEN